MVAHPFIPPPWQTIGLPFGLDMSNEERRGLVEGIRTARDGYVGVCGMRNEFGVDQPAAVIAIEAFNPADLFASTVLGHIEAAVIPDSESWAMVCSPDGFSLLAAEPRVLSVLTSPLGGVAALRRQLDARIDEGEYGSAGAVRAALHRVIDDGR